MASEFEYATVAEVRSFADNPDLDAMSDSDLEEFITRAEGLVNSYAGQVFTPDNQASIQMTGDNSNWLQLPHSPIQRVTRMYIDTQELDPKHVYVTQGGRIQLRRDGNQTVFPDTDVGNVQIDYTFGYAEVPAVVNNATVVISTILAQGGDDGIVQSQTDGKITISAKVGEDLSAQAKGYLDAIGRGSFASGLAQTQPFRLVINAEQSKFVRNINR